MYIAPPLLLDPIARPQERTHAVQEFVHATSMGWRAYHHVAGAEQKNVQILM